MVTRELTQLDTKWFRHSFIWLILMVLVLAVAVNIFKNQGTSSKSVTQTAMMGQLQKDVKALKAKGCSPSATGCQDKLSQTGNDTVTLKTFNGTTYTDDRASFREYH